MRRSDKDSKVSMLPGQPTTPEFVLHKLLEQVEGMEEIVAVIHWKNNTVSAALNDMDISTLCVLHKFLGVEIDRIMRGEATSSPRAPSETPA